MRKAGMGALALVLAFAGAAVALRPPKVPPAAIEASVNRQATLMERAFALPVARSFGKDLAWQSNGSLCGPASLANTFRSLGESANNEALVLDGSGKCWSGYCFMGLTLDELGALAKSRTKRQVTVLRNLSEQELREHLVKSNDPGRRYVINFTRKTIFGAGGGHHSPIGGYLEAEDLVLVLDVNREFRPWLVERPRLHAAINTLDGDQKRGLLLIE